ncbi:GNAT family N-acetyltransferase [Consotaella aegiceratis]|uniref:GNAT family N-acetyltransferase n=1 Tax=Consotaella aegiceratis TaxID=3097961 RepID=UPI002F4095A1
MIPLVSDRLIIRPWEERDRPRFHEMNSDETVMRFFPFRRNRDESDALMDRLNERFTAHAMTFFALERRDTSEVIGFTGLSPVGTELPFGPAVEIGWRLMPSAWGQGFATEAAAACLDYGFDELGLSEIVSFCVESNVKSAAVMLRLGFVEDEAGRFAHPTIDPQRHPELSPHRLFRLAKQRWIERRRPA